MTLKKITIALAAALLALCLVACAASDEGESTYQAPEQNKPSGSVNDPVYTGSDIADSPFIGSFTNTYCTLYASNAGEFYVEYADEPADGTPSSQPLKVTPSLVCTADGDFTFTFNTDLEGSYAVASGTFKVNDDCATFTVESIQKYGDAEGFDGENLTEFAMQMTSNSEMLYSGDQAGYVTTGDVFRRNAN